MKQTPTTQTRPDDERRLMAAARGGDRGAFGALVEQHMRPAYYTALGLVGAHDAALDLSQEAFARAFRARESLDPNRPFRPWLHQILRRLCFNWTRDRRRRPVADIDTQWLADTSSATPEQAAERTQMRERVMAALEELSDREREVFVLKELEGLKYREIAELLGVPIGTVTSRLYAARRHLASRLEEVRP